MEQIQSEQADRTKDLEQRRFKVKGIAFPF